MDQNDNNICDNNESATFIVEKCILKPGLVCVSHKVEPTKITLVIANGFGRSITVNSIDVRGCNSEFSEIIPSGKDHTFVIGGSCDNGAIQEIFKSNITLSYTEKDTGLTRTTYGELVTKIE